MNPKRFLLALILVAGLVGSGCTPSENPDGAVSVGDGPLECGRRATPISAVQGASAMSPLVGERVEVEARISAKFLDGLGGFYLVSEPGSEDDDPATSEGVFVRHGDPLDWPVGSRVRVRATVAELGAAPDTQTALIEVTQMVRCKDAPIALAPRPISSVGQGKYDWERHEGERIAVAGPVTLISNEDLLRHGTLIVSFDGRDYAPTERYIPGQAARALAEANLATRLIIDDARREAYPKQLWHLPDPLTPSTAYRLDSQVFGIDGVLEQYEGEYRVQLVSPISRVIHAPRPTQPPEVDGDLRVASFNVLNYFNGDGRGGGFPTERGAKSRVAFERQTAKIVAALDALDADIVALMEVENDGYAEDSAISNLVRALNATRGKARGDYAFVRAPAERLGQDSIAVGLIYRTSRVRAEGPASILEGGPFARWSRPSLAQRFVFDELDFVVVANHFKSKGCQDAEGLDQDQEDGQGCFNAKRVESARLLADWLAGDPLATGHDRVLVVGDFNAYGNEDPIRLLTHRGFVDVVAAHSREPAYSYVHRGAAGRLDHALVSTSLAVYVGGAAVWHINADESDGFRYDEPDRDRRALKTRFRPDPFRSSDHDPILIGLRRQPQAVTPISGD